MTFIKSDCPRAIDRHIDFFGDSRVPPREPTTPRPAPAVVIGTGAA